MKECELQKAVIDDIKNSNFGRKINCKIFEHNTNTLNFSIDNMLKHRYTEYASNIIKSIKTDLEIVSSIKNINMKDGRLLPDILTFGLDERFYVFELKVGKKTGREAITELMAYRQEVRNHLPLLSNNEVCFVIISEEYSVLLKHAITSLVYEHIPVLCLKPNYDAQEQEIESYNIVEAVDWTKINAEITKQLLDGYFILWYSKEYKKSIDLTDFMSERIFAIEYLKDEALINGGNGIAYVCDRPKHDNALYATGLDFGIAVFAVNSYALACQTLMDYKDSLTKYVLDKRGNDITGPVLEVETEKMCKLLKDKYSLGVETFNNLDCYENLVFTHWNIQYCDAWGDLGKELRDFYYQHRSALFEDKEFHEPEIFMKIVNIFFSNFPFKECCGKGEYFQLGALFYIVINEAEIVYRLNGDSTGMYRVRLVWSFLFCSIYKLIPQYVVDKRNCLSFTLLQSFIQRLKKAGEFFYIQINNEEYKQAFDWGRKNAYFSEIIPSSFLQYQVVEDFSFLDDEDSLVDFQQYFYENVMILVEGIKKESCISEESWNVLLEIFISNDIWEPDLSTVSSNNIDKRKRMVFDNLKKFCQSEEVRKINRNMFSKDSIRNCLRRLLNARV